MASLIILRHPKHDILTQKVPVIETPQVKKVIEPKKSQALDLDSAEFNFFSPLTELEPLHFDLKTQKPKTENIDLMAEFDWSEKKPTQWKITDDDADFEIA